MAEHLQDGPGNSWAESGAEFDDIKDLYIAAITAAPGAMDGITRAGRTTWYGEILVYGSPEGEGFRIEHLRRFALYGVFEEEIPEETLEIGVVSLGGPLEPVNLQQGRAEGVLLTLHYAALSRLSPRIESDDATYPQVEEVVGTITWKPLERVTADRVLMELSFEAILQEGSRLRGLINRITLDPIVLTFRLAGSSAVDQIAVFALASTCAPPTTPCPGGTTTVTRQIGIHIIDFSTVDPATLEDDCNEQIRRACAVWRQKAAFNIQPLSAITPGSSPQRKAYAQLDQTQEFDVLSTVGLAAPAAGAPPHALPDLTRLDIYIVDKLLDRPGGGIAHNANQASVFCILDRRKINQTAGTANPYLLAHELGHALNLAHPDGTGGDLPSSPGTIMEPGDPNPSFNTLYNCRIFTTPSVLNQLVSHTTMADCFRPDRVDHFIRDFVADSGTEPSVPPAGQDWWSASNVWNRRSNTTGGLNANGSRQHEEPWCTDGQNFMHIQLDHRTTPRDPVEVSLYITEPGAAPGSTLLSPLAPNHMLSFTSPAHVSGPSILSLPWSPASRPAGYPPHACVLAIATSIDEPWPSGLPRTFANVMARRASDNDIAQRNINFLNCSLLRGQPLRIMLPWVQIVNPFTEAIDARIEIDTTQSADLIEITFELDNEILSTVIRPGHIDMILVSQSLPPDKPGVIRLYAVLPDDLDLGREMPIGLRFLLGGQMLNGYNHVLRITKPADAVAQVIDRMVGMLQDVGSAFRLDSALSLARSITRIVRQYAQLPKEALNALRRQIRRFADLAQELDPSAAPEAQDVQRWLFELSGVLTSWNERRQPELVIEQVRELTDRIQERAGRRARRALVNQSG